MAVKPPVVLMVLVSMPQKTCTPPNGCYSSKCDPQTAECVFSDKCDDKNLCTLDSCEGGVCKNVAIDCEDASKCTLNACVSGACSSSNTECDDGIECTLDSCDSNLGCSNNPDDSFCKTLNPCVNQKCDKLKGCVATNITCPDTGLICILSACVPYEGCANTSVVCPYENNTCTFTRCVEDKKKNCKTEELECAALLDTTIIAAAAAGISAAVIAAIIAAVVICGGVATGASLAIYKRSNDEGMAMVSNNPLFVESTSSGINPIARV